MPETAGYRVDITKENAIGVNMKSCAQIQEINNTTQNLISEERLGGGLNL